MTFEEADELLKRILIFLNKQGGAYSRIPDVATMQKTILLALRDGTYHFSDKAFVCWHYIDDLLYVDDAAGDLAEIRRVLRKNLKNGIAWHSQKKDKKVINPRKRS